MDFDKSLKFTGRVRECIFTTKLMVQSFLLYFMSSTINLALTTPLG